MAFSGNRSVGLSRFPISFTVISHTSLLFYLRCVAHKLLGMVNSRSMRKPAASPSPRQPHLRVSELETLLTSHFSSVDRSHAPHFFLLSKQRDRDDSQNLPPTVAVSLLCPADEECQDARDDAALLERMRALWHSLGNVGVTFVLFDPSCGDEDVEKKEEKKKRGRGAAQKEKCAVQQLLLETVRGELQRVRVESGMQIAFVGVDERRRKMLLLHALLDAQQDELESGGGASCSSTTATAHGLEAAEIEPPRRRRRQKKDQDDQ